MMTKFRRFSLPILFLCGFFLVSYVGVRAAGSFTSTHGDVQPAVTAGTIDPNVLVRWRYIGGFGAVSSIVIDPINSANVYIGPDTDSYPVMYSRNYGETWQEAAEPPEGAIASMAIDPVNPSRLFAGLRFGGIYRSVNSGAAWDLVDDGVTETDTISALFVHPITPTLVFAGSDSGTPTVYRSDDGGETWDDILLTDPSNRHVHQFLVHPTLPHILYVVVHNLGVYQSEDEGLTWQPMGIQAESMVIDPTNPDIIYRIHCELYRSVNGGEDWEQITTPAPCYQNVHMDPMNSAVLYLTSQYRYVTRTVDGGNNWTILDKSVDGGAGPLSYLLAIDPIETTTLYAAGIHKIVYLDQTTYLPDVHKD
jgi:photosystem II stability/assembly factor-like uncharacterized protein